MVCFEIFQHYRGTVGDNIIMEPANIFGEILNVVSFGLFQHQRGFGNIMALFVVETFQMWLPTDSQGKLLNA